MNDPETQARQVLREWRDRLASTAAILHDDTTRLQGSRDRAALDAHTARLQEHQRELERFRQALERFHDHFGPLGT